MRSRKASTCWLLARAGQNQAEAAFLDLGQQLVGALEGLDLTDELVELLRPGPAQVVPVLLLDLPTTDRGDELVPTHPDAAVEAPDRADDVEAAQGAEPREGVLVVGVHEGAVDVEDCRVCHGPFLPHRTAATPCAHAHGQLDESQRQPGWLQWGNVSHRARSAVDTRVGPAASLRRESTRSCDAVSCSAAQLRVVDGRIQALQGPGLVRAACGS